MNIKITLRLGSATLSRQAHKQIAFSEHVMGIPVQVIFVNIEVGNILLCVPFQAAIHNIIKITIQFAIGHYGSLLFDLFIVVYDLIYIDVILVIAIVVNNELARNGGHNVTQGSLNEGK